MGQCHTVADAGGAKSLTRKQRFDNGPGRYMIDGFGEITNFGKQTFLATGRGKHFNPA